MASAWGDAWSAAWGNSWGAIEVVTPPVDEVLGALGGYGPRRRREDDEEEDRHRERRLFRKPHGEDIERVVREKFKKVRAAEKAPEAEQPETVEARTVVEPTQRVARPFDVSPELLAALAPELFGRVQAPSIQYEPIQIVPPLLLPADDEDAIIALLLAA